MVKNSFIFFNKKDKKTKIILEAVEGPSFFELKSSINCIVL